jgi:type 1 glutamine amidotransferase
MRVALLTMTLLLGCGAGPGSVDSAGKVKVVLVAGAPSHGPGEHEYTAGALLLARMLEQRGDVAAIVVRGGWPTNVAAFDGARSIVYFSDGNAGHPLVQGDRLEKMAAILARGVGFVCLHWAVHFPDTTADRVLPLLGGYYSDAISTNPIWLADFADVPAHPANRGVAPFQLTDEWYFNLRFSPESARLATVLHAVPPDPTRLTADAALHPGRSETVAWAFERADGGRSFGFTGAHFHRNWGEAPFRRVVLDAILWTAGVEVPAGGADAAFDPAWLQENLDPK